MPCGRAPTVIQCAVPILLDQLPDDANALKRIIAGMAQDAVNAQAEIARLRFQLARYRCE